MSIAVVVAVLALVWFSALSPSVALADKNPNPGVLPPNSKAYGMTYGEWSVKWWQWALSIPAPTSPLLDTTGANVATGQSGNVWFLAGALCVTAPSVGNPNPCQHYVVTRDVTIPHGKALFFPIANSEWDNLGVTPPLDVTALRAAAKAAQDSVVSMSASIDGMAVQGLNPLTSPYRVTSPVFSYTIPGNSIYQALGYPFGAQTVSPVVGDGVYLMVAPLSTGKHTIHFTAVFPGDFSLDVTYNITVG